MFDPDEEFYKLIEESRSIDRYILNVAGEYDAKVQRAKEKTRLTGKEYPIPKPTEKEQAAIEYRNGRNSANELKRENIKKGGSSFYPSRYGRFDKDYDVSNFIKATADEERDAARKAGKKYDRGNNKRRFYNSFGMDPLDPEQREEDTYWDRKNPRKNILYKKPGEYLRAQQAINKARGKKY